MPATRQDIWQVINRQKLKDINSIIICLEDAVHDNDITEALYNLTQLLEQWQQKTLSNHDFIAPKQRPLVYIRPRNYQMLKELASYPYIDLVDGFVLPKFDLDSLLDWKDACKSINKNQYLMPTLETKKIFNQQHNQQLAKILSDSFEQTIFAIRIGGNDLLSCLSLRRPKTLTIYESPIGHVIHQILTTFILQGYYITAPVFEYLDNVELLIKEVEQDVMYGFVGKTIIHPNQIAIVKQAFKVSNDELAQAKEVLATDAKAVFRKNNTMLEPATHKQWAKKTIKRKQIFNNT